MKTKFLLLIFLFFYVCVSAQDGMKAFTSQNGIMIIYSVTTYAYQPRK